VRERLGEVQRSAPRYEQHDAEPLRLRENLAGIPHQEGVNPHWLQYCPQKILNVDRLKLLPEEIISLSAYLHTWAAAEEECVDVHRP
jgi:hypothetical protein